MDRRRWMLCIAVFAAGCGATPDEADLTPALVRCLERHGGQQISRLAQLDRIPSADPQHGTSYGLDSIAFLSLDVDTGKNGARQALVFIQRHDDAKGRWPSAATELRRAGRSDLAAALPERDDRIEPDVDATLVMPASKDWDRPLSQCAHEAAGDEISVP